jgi:hypothetical protein
MPRAKSTPVKTNNKKLVVAERICTFHLEVKTVRENANGKSYIAVNLREYGYDKPVAVYANIDDIEAGKIYTLVQFEPSKAGETGMLALNEPTAKERLKFFCDLKSEFAGMELADIKSELGIID